jgi:SAM-dependent methyltransferase
MSYKVEHISCKVCGSDKTKFLGIRGNLEYAGALPLKTGEEHIVTNVVQCRKCGFVYTNPFILTSGGNKGYVDPDEYCPSAENIDSKILFGYSISLIERYVPGKGTLLDIGCGKGEFLALAKEKGWQAYGIEPSEKFADYATKKYNLDIKLDIKNSNFQGSFFDVVTLNMVLEHLDSPKATLLEIRRVLKDNGFLFIEVPNMDSWMLKLATLYFRLNKKGWSPLLSPLHHPFHCYGYNMFSLRSLLKNAGFRIKRFIISDTHLRGMYLRPSVSTLEKKLCRIAGRIASFIGKGDVLMAIATKI